MRGKSFSKHLILGCLVAALILTQTSVFTIAQDSSASEHADSQQDVAVIKNKSEVIYANLDAEGKINSVYAVNHFNMSQFGSIVDYGSYESVVNLSDTNSLHHSEDSVSFQTDKENFYYQGNMKATNLPWIFTISYYLDGEKTQPQDIPGKFGKLKIAIVTQQNEKIAPTFYENYMLQLSMTLDTDKCSNIEAPGATIARAGKNKMVVHTVMPENDADIHVTADVRDFTMAGIEISAMPFNMNMEMPETDDMINNFKELSDAIADLNTGVGGLTDGVADLKTGAVKLEKGSADFQKGLSQINENSGQLVGASAQINDALAEIASSLSSDLAGDDSLGDLNQLPQALTQLAQGLKEISGGLSILKDGFTPAYAALDTAINGIPASSITEEQIIALYASAPLDHHDLISSLVDSYEAGLTAKGTYDHVKEAFDAVAPTNDVLSSSIDTISRALEVMSENIAESLSSIDAMEQIKHLSSGLTELSANYTEFHKGLTDYMDGVDELDVGYSSLHTGTSAFHDGVGELHSGAAKLHRGTNVLNVEVADMPNTIQSEIDELLKQYGGTDFEPISFTSPKNEHTAFVQFVLKSEAIEKQQEAEDIPDEPEKKTVWDRFLALFSRS